MFVSRGITVFGWYNKRVLPTLSDKFNSPPTPLTPSRNVQEQKCSWLSSWQPRISHEVSLPKASNPTRIQYACILFQTDIGHSRPLNLPTRFSNYKQWADTPGTSKHPFTSVYIKILPQSAQPLELHRSIQYDKAMYRNTTERLSRHFTRQSASSLGVSTERWIHQLRCRGPR